MVEVTKTRVRLVDHLAGVSAEEIVVGPANLGLGSEACWNQIEHAIDLAGLDPPVRYVVGLAGTEYRTERQQFLHQLLAQPFWFLIVTQAYLVLIAGPGVV